jgi:hypothetical protein
MTTSPFPTAAWGKLWDIATAEEGAPARVELHPEDAGRVTLAWPDGSRGGLYWHDGEWRHEESASSGAPGDVAARDSL